MISTVKEKRRRVKEKTPVEKLIESTRPHPELDTSKIALTSIAGMIALTGLFMNNVAVVIGAMLISPLLGSIYAFAINTAVGRTRNAVRSILNLIVLLVMVIFFSFLTTVVISHFTGLSLTPEIHARMEFGVIYILIALFFGVAPIFALSKNIPETIVGVAIAAALLPPAVVMGISLVLYPSKVLNPMILTIENILGLMAGSLFATLLLDIEPRGYYKRAAARKFIVRVSLCYDLDLIVRLLIFVVIGLFKILTNNENPNNQEREKKLILSLFCLFKGPKALN